MENLQNAPGRFLPDLRILASQTPQANSKIFPGLIPERTTILTISLSLCPGASKLWLAHFTNGKEGGIGKALSRSTKLFEIPGNGADGKSPTFEDQDWGIEHESPQKISFVFSD